MEDNQDIKEIKKKIEDEQRAFELYVDAVAQYGLSVLKSLRKKSKKKKKNKYKKF